MIKFELYLCGTLFREYVPESMDGFLYNPNLTPFENRKYFWYNVSVYIEAIKSSNESSINSFEDYGIIMLYQPDENI